MRVLHKPLGRQSYEGLAEWAGGSSWRIATQVALLMLLWGTLCSGLALLSDVAVVMADMAFPGGEAPAWLSGRLLMTAMALLVLFPLCLLRHMRQVCVGLAVCVCVGGCVCGWWGAAGCGLLLVQRSRPTPQLVTATHRNRAQLESAATVGVGLVVGLILLLAVRASLAGFPGIEDGEVPLWSVTLDKHLPEAFSVLGEFLASARVAAPTGHYIGSAWLPAAASAPLHKRVAG